MLRGAVIGLGNVALKVHLPALARRENVEIVAVTDVAADRRAAVADLLPGARWYDSAAALLDGERLDFIDICTPPSSHAALIDAGLARGFHVLCEKPLVCSRDELAPLTERAAASGRVLHTVHNWHHAPIIKRTAQLLREEAIGPITHVAWQTLRTEPAPVRDAHDGNWRLDPLRAGGGILSDHGWHVFYLLRWWIGEAPTAVSARLETRRHTAFPVEDTATVRVTFPSATAEIFLTWAADRRQNTVELRGDGSRIALDGETIVLTRDGHSRAWTCPPPLSSGSVHPDWFDPVLDEFLGEVTGALPRNGNLAEASLCLVLESLARESSGHGGRTTPVPAMP